MNKFNIKVGDWCYVFGDDVFVQISKIEYDSNNNIKNVYAADDYNVIYANSSLTWICHENKDPEKIFQKLSYEELEERNINIKH